MTVHNYRYNGKELQTHEFSNDQGLEYLDFGARMYDPQIGRFFTQDPYANVFGILSPYQIGANNPISFIDENGEYITISKTGITVIYENGEGYIQKERNGEIIKEKYKGSDSFILTAISDLKQISKSELGKTIVSDLQNSSESLTIQELKVNNGKYGLASNAISYSQNEFSLSQDKVKMKSYITLAHELAHAWADIIGLASQFEGKEWGTLRHEIFGVRFENYIRAMNGETKMRMSYDGWSLTHSFKESSPEYFKNFTLPYRRNEFKYIRIDGNKEIPGRARMDATYHRTNIIERHDLRYNKIKLFREN